jgi:hypothetical protein
VGDRLVLVDSGVSVLVVVVMRTIVRLVLEDVNVSVLVAVLIKAFAYRSLYKTMPDVYYHFVMLDIRHFPMQFKNATESARVLATLSAHLFAAAVIVLVMQVVVDMKNAMYTP